MKAYLIKEIPILHSPVSSNLLINFPTKLFIQLPGHCPKNYGKECHQARNGSQYWAGLNPISIVVDEVTSSQISNSIMNLIWLNGSINQDTAVHDYKTD